MSLWNVGDMAAAMEASRRAIDLDPNHLEMWLYLGKCESVLGNFETAAKHYRHALAIDPSYQDAKVGLSSLHLDYGLSDLEHLGSVLHDPHGNLRDRTLAGFALGDSLNQKGRYEEAFAATAEANRLRRAMLPPSVEVFDVDMLRRIFPPEVFQETAAWGDPSALPVFIVGLPRSGTTLVEQIIASHRSAFGAGELEDIIRLVRLVEDGQGYRPPREWNPLTVRRAAAQHLVRLSELGGDALRVVDKMPDNVMYVGHISILFPNARIILCRRDLRDVGVSCFMQAFSDKMNWTNDLTDIAVRIRETERLVALWREVLPRPMLEVQYEELIANPEAESRRLIEFLGLDWDPTCLSFHETKRPVTTSSFWQVRQPLYSSSVGRWRNYRKHLGPLLEGLAGYLPDERA
jgi:tetratricopeptide (TPR) repeat protein